MVRGVFKVKRHGVDVRNENMIQKTFNAHLTNLDYLSFLLDRGLYRDGDEIYIDADDPSNFVTFKELISLTKQVAYSLRTKEGIGANGIGEDTVGMFSSNQVFPVRIIVM
jgi:acyl-CoA synthetase (AMP-forming)/AMP-acid ligase II